MIRNHRCQRIRRVRFHQNLLGRYSCRNTLEIDPFIDADTHNYSINRNRIFWPLYYLLAELSKFQHNVQLCTFSRLFDKQLIACGNVLRFMPRLLYTWDVAFCSVWVRCHTALDLWRILDSALCNCGSRDLSKRWWWKQPHQIYYVTAKVTIQVCFRQRLIFSRYQ